MITWTTGKLIGQPGGFGAVYESQKDVNNNLDTKIYAKKVLLNSDDDSIQRFKREIRICKRLNHPNIIKVVSYELTSPPYYYIMNKYNYSMETIIQDIRFNYDRLKIITNSIFDGIEYLHNEGVLHRDLKPANILMNSDNDLVIADFGLGIQLNSCSARLTRTNIGIGTRFYISPEQMNDLANVDEKTDIYSLGCIIYQCVANEFNYILDYTKIPTSFDFVISKATKTNKQDRFSSISELRSAFNSAITLVNEKSIKYDGEEIIAKIDSNICTPTFISSVANYLEDNISNVDLIHDLIMKLNAEQLNLLENNHFNLLKQIIKKFTDDTISHRWGFSYTDTIGDQCDYLIKNTSNKEIIANLLFILVVVGYEHNRWYVMDLASKALCSIKDDTTAFLFIELLGKKERYVEALNLSIEDLISPLQKFAE
ncbi:hypothetical protein AN1V17_33600 [Vallitalea sediminicola]